MEQFIEVLLKYMDPIAVIIAVGITQLIRYFLPSPEGGGKFDVTDKIYRFLPVSPILWAILAVFFRLVWIDANPLPIDEAICKGLVSGFAAAYFYRAVKILIFGKGGFEKGKAEYNKIKQELDEHKRHLHVEDKENKEEEEDPR
jgi:hypothetical protein